MAGMFDYTQAKYWGGPSYSYWTLILMTVVGGFFGLDHLWLRSPQTAFLKAIIPTFGLWYLYDLLQVCGDQELVMKYGLTAPAVGPLGIGAEMFVDDDDYLDENKKLLPDVQISKSPFRYLAYMLLVWLPFGLDFFVAGDTYGGFAMLLSFISIILWPITFIWICFNIFKAVFMPKTLFEFGPTRMFPFTLVWSETGPSKLGPKDIEPEGLIFGFFHTLFNIALNLPMFRAAKVVGMGVKTLGAIKTAQKVAKSAQSAAKTLGTVSDVTGIGAGTAAAAATLTGVKTATATGSGPGARAATAGGCR
jgi:hypothetical protein